MLEMNAVPDEPLDPEPDRAGKDGEGSDSNLSGTLPTAPGARPWKECQNRARRSLLVSEIEMVGGGIVEVDGPLDQTHAEHAGVKVQILLRIARDRRDVVNPR